MPVPDFQTLMLPMLQIVADGREHTVSSLADSLRKQFGLSERDIQELLPSGRQSRFRNRVAWAAVYLDRAGVLQRIKRGVFAITQRGRDLLQENPQRIDIKALSRYEEFQQFRARASASEGTPDQKEPETQTPEERLAASYHQIRESLAADLLEAVMKSSPTFFEKLVLDLLVGMGYGGSRDDAEKVGRSGDGGIDGIIKEDKLGFDAVYVQAKRWSGGVGRPIVQAFAGALEPHRAKKGVMITTSHYSEDAKEYVKRIEKTIILIDGPQLAQFMIDYGVGVTTLAAYEVKKLDLDYFEEAQ